MLATLGDLVDDVVCRLATAVRRATDTVTTIERRRGGSAANVAAVAAVLGAPVRFIGQVGDDAVGAALVAELASAGVDTTCVRRAGATGTIVVLVDPDGERSMLTDRRTCAELDRPEPAWLDDVDVLHVPLYSLVDGATASTATTVIGWAHDRDVAVSIDLSSTALLERLGADRLVELVTSLQPAIVFANAEEADAVGGIDAIPSPIAVVKHGALPAVVRGPDGSVVPVPALAIGAVTDSTGAGDAFAAGFLTFPGRLVDQVGAVTAGHAAAAALLSGRR